MPAINSSSEVKWGPWAFDPSNFTLNLTSAGSRRHSIELRNLTSSSCLLDVIFEVNEKEWANQEITAGLLAALQDLFDPRVNLCGKAESRSFDPVAHFETAVDANIGQSSPDVR